MTTLTITATFVIDNPLTMTPPTIPNGLVGQAYSFQLSGVSGGTPPYVFSATSLPPGLTCSPSGLISGTPTTAGTYNATITVKDSSP